MGRGHDPNAKNPGGHEGGIIPLGMGDAKPNAHTPLYRYSRGFAPCGASKAGKQDITPWTTAAMQSLSLARESVA